MTTDEILSLGNLARISLTDTEVAAFSKDIDSILSYVSVVKNIAAETNTEPNLGVRFNVLRPDEVTNTPGQYTDDMHKGMPATQGPYLLVKKILKMSE